MKRAVVIAIAAVLVTACGASLITPHDPGPCGEGWYSCADLRGMCCPNDSACGRPGTADDGWCQYVGEDVLAEHHPRTPQRKAAP